MRMILIIICTIYEQYPLDEPEQPSCDSTQVNALSNTPDSAMAYAVYHLRNWLSGFSV